MKPRGHYGNFDDAFGLVMRMLKSGEAPALWALVLAAAGVLAKPLDALMARREARAVANASESTGPMILIVGAPRSGTTLVYQVLASSLDISLFNNATALFPRSPISGGAWLGGGRSRTMKRFQSYYGNSSGLSAPNDGFAVWNRWLGADRYQAATSLPDDTAADMRRFFGAWRARYGKPFLNKNNRNADCVALLARALPEAVFVEVTRDRASVVASLIRARKTVQGDESRAWGLRASDASDTDASPVTAVSRQLQLIHERLATSRASVDTSRYIRVSYEAFCEDPASVVRAIADQVPGVDLKPGSDPDALSPFRVSSDHGLDSTAIAEIDAVFAESGT